MTWRMVCRSERSTASLARWTDRSYRPMPTVIRMSKIVMTIINSRSVKPSQAPRFLPLKRRKWSDLSCATLLVAAPSFRAAASFYQSEYLVPSSAVP